jgi:hypothetical protein
MSQQSFPVPPGGRDGMTLRDYFAAKAMQSAMTACDLMKTSPSDFASVAYQMADAMMEARK